MAGEQRPMVMRLRVAIVLIAAVACSLTLTRAADAAGLESGERSNLVAHLQSELRDIYFYRGPIDGVFGPMTAQAVMAFHKHLGLERSFEWRPEDWAYLDEFDPIEHAGDARVVVDLDRQVLYVHRPDQSVAVIPVSTANGERYIGRGGRLTTARTPTGEFTFYRHVDGQRISYLGALWRPWYFYGGYAIHGSSSVPAQPASHGCIRVPNWEADWLAGELRIGMTVSITRSGGVEPPEIQPPPSMDRERILERAE